MKIKSQGSASNSLYKQNIYQTFSELFFWDWRVDINKIFADMYDVFFSTGCHFVVALSARSYKDRSCINRRTMIYCELWGGVRMSNHCDVTFTEWGLPLPLILSTTAFDECTDWLLSGMPDYFGRNKIWVVMICPIIKCLTVLRVFFYFVWFVFIHHNFQFYFELCTYCNILDIYLS